MMDLSVKHVGMPMSAQGLASHFTSAAVGAMKSNKMALNYSTQGGGEPGAISGGASPTYSGATDSFPYGISGVSMPNYGYTGDLYQFTSNGYPRKSRTCCYCGKVFTRSTTRRYHEKRCPLLRAAVCGIVPDNGKRRNGLTLPGHPSSSSTSMPGLVPPKSSLPNNHLSLATSQLSSSPHRPAMLKRDENGLGYHQGVIMTPDAQETKNRDYSLPLDLERMQRLTPDSDRSSPRQPKLSETMDYPAAYRMYSGMNLSKSPPSVSVKDELNTSYDLKQEFKKEENESDYDRPASNSYRDHRLDSATPMGSEEHKRTSPAQGDVLSFAERSTSPKMSHHEGSNDFTDISDNEKEDMQIEEDKEAAPGEVKCGVCGKIFESTLQLHVHEQIHKKFKPYACQFCGERFSKPILRIEHEKTHRDPEKLLCAICGDEMGKEQLAVHVIDRHQEAPWNCRHCGKASMTHIEFLEHLQSHNLQQEELFSLQILTHVQGQQKSPKDDRANSEYDENDSENINETDNLSMSDSNENLNSPGQESPLENAPTPDQEPASQEKEKCTICGHDFPKNHMAHHLKCHEGQKPYECPICGKRFGYKNNMKSHIKLHAGIKPYQCNVCGAKFTRGSTLRRHARRHGISAESVWDLFVRNGNTNQPPNQQQDQMLAARKSFAAAEPITSTPIHNNTTSMKDYVGHQGESSYGSMYNTSTSAAMSNALLMSYHNHQAAMNAASLTSLFSPLNNSTSSDAPKSAGFHASSHMPQ